MFGRIVTVVPERSFLFIRPGDNHWPDLFAPMSEVDATMRDDSLLDRWVQFDLAPTDRRTGFMAVHVRDAYAD